MKESIRKIKQLARTIQESGRNQKKEFIDNRKVSFAQSNLLNTIQMITAGQIGLANDMYDSHKNIFLSFNSDRMIIFLRNVIKANHNHFPRYHHTQSIRIYMNDFLNQLVTNGVRFNNLDINELRQRINNENGFDVPHVYGTYGKVLSDTAEEILNNEVNSIQIIKNALNVFAQAQGGNGVRILNPNQNAHHYTAELKIQGMAGGQRAYSNIAVNHQYPVFNSVGPHL